MVCEFGNVKVAGHALDDDCSYDLHHTFAFPHVAIWGTTFHQPTSSQLVCRYEGSITLTFNQFLTSINQGLSIPMEEHEDAQFVSECRDVWQSSAMRTLRYIYGFTE